MKNCLKRMGIFILAVLLTVTCFPRTFAFADESSPGNVIVKSIASKEGIAGITFAVYAYDAPDFEPMELVGRGTTSETGVVLSEDLNDGTYLVVEENVPSQYEKDLIPHMFTVKKGVSSVVVYQHTSNGKDSVSITEEEKQVPEGVTIANTDSQKEYYQDVATLTADETKASSEGSVSVNVSIIDTSTGSPLQGIAMSIKNENGEEVANWNSGESYEVVQGLTDGAKYTLTEKIPSEYVSQEPFEFTAREGMQIAIKVDPISLDFLDVDATDGATISGAEFKLTSSDGNSINITTTDVIQKITKIKPGEYTLSQTKTPEGYVKAEDSIVNISNSADGNKISIENSRVKGHVDITLKDSNDKPIANGKFILKVAPSTASTGENSEGKLTDKELYNQSEALETITTNEDGKVSTSDVEIGVYANGEMNTKRTYFVSQESAPEGYTASTKIYKVEFKYADDKTPVVAENITIKNEGAASATEEGAANSQSGGVQTSDVMAIVLIVAIVALIASSIYLLKKKHTKGE